MPTLDADRIDTASFDSYGTLVDTDSAARVLDDVVDDPQSVAATWRANALEYSLVGGHTDEYRTYFELHLDGLRDALRVEGVTLADDRLRELNAVYHDLEAFDDVRAGFERLHEAGYRPSILSNGDPEMLDSLVEVTGVGPYLNEAVSADEIETLKPQRALYEHAADKIGVSPDRHVHVTAHWMDVRGATRAGMAGVWLRRNDGLWPSFGDAPTATVASFDELCEALDA